MMPEDLGAMMEAAGAMDASQLTLVSEALEPYVFSYGSPDGVEGQVDMLALVVMRRSDAFLLAVPAGALDPETLNQGAGGDPGIPLGPYHTVEVPGVVLDGGVISPTGTLLSVVIIDCLNSLAGSLRVPSDQDGAVVVFDADDVPALPAPDGLLAAATSWISSADPGRVGFYSAESAAGTPIATPRAKPKPKKKSTPGEATPTAAGQPKKKVTTAALAENLDNLMATLPNLTSQMTSLVERQKQLEVQMSTSQTRSILSRPLGGSLALPQGSLSAMASQLSPPPRTAARRAPGLLESPAVFKPVDVEELEEEKKEPEGGDALARAVYAQSQALTTLVNQIASAQGDPMADLALGSGGMGSKGAAGRAKLQQELAAHRGTFYVAVLNSMARRMSPTMPMASSSQALLDRGISGTHYLERFGGYGRHRELGHIQYQVMTALDFLMAGNIPAVQDTIALMGVMIEQMVLDNGRMEVAGLLCLQEDVPANVFSNRLVTSTARTRSFAPLADQKWITVALQYLREMDVINNKRQEFAGKTSGGGSDPTDDPKPKVRPKSKQKGRGRGGFQNQVEEES